MKAVEADLSGQIDKKAQNLVESKLNALQGVYEAKRRALDSEYKALTVSHEGFLFGCLLYGILLLLLILVHIVYVLIRWYVKGCKRSRGYY